MTFLENATLLQLYSFLIYLVSGIIIGIFFDVFRILRKSFHTSDLLTYIEDIIFWIITGLFLFSKIVLLFNALLFQISDGEIRIYNIIALLLGGILYLLTMSKIFIKINVKIMTFIKSLLHNIVLIPLKGLFFIIKKLFTPFTFFVINVKKIILNPSKKLKRLAKKKNKKQKVVTERRILRKNVEKYN